MKIVPHLALGGAFILLGYMLDCVHRGGCARHSDNLLDGALDDTFPASDPTATQDFSAPEERHSPQASAQAA